MKRAQVKTITLMILIFLMGVFLIYALPITTLTSPADNTVDDDGYLDLRGSCEPFSANNFDGTTVWNITNATLYSNVGGSWVANKTLQVGEGSQSNATYFFNFTNYINQSAEGEFQWSIQCNQNNQSDTSVIEKSFTGNRTIKVEYGGATVTTTTPPVNSYDIDGIEIDVVCTATPSSGFNITRIDIISEIKEVSCIRLRAFTYL